MACNVVDSGLRQQVYTLIGQIPAGRVMTYGQMAALCGHARAARQVGQIAHWGPSELPWHRLVNKAGCLAGAFTGGGREGQARLLREEGVEVKSDYCVDIGRLIWWPDDNSPTVPENSQAGSG